MTSKRTVRGNGGRRFAFGGGLGSLGALFASQAQAQTQDGAPNDFIRIDALEGVQSYEVQADGTLKVLLADGRTIALAADQFVTTEAGLFLDLPALTEAMTAVAAVGVGANPLLLPLIAGVGAGGLAAAGGGGGGGDSDSGSPAPVAPPANRAPVFTSSATATVAENTTTTVYTATATDADGNTLTYSLSGTDAALFNINGTTGAVTFKTSPNFEAPADAGADNAYSIVVSASDGAATTSRAVVITVTNLNDNAPAITSAEATGTATQSGVTTAAGSIAFADADSGNSHSVNVVASGTGYLGAFTATLADSATLDGVGRVSWSYAADNADLTYLAEGEMLSQVYVISLSDGVATVTQNVVITIAGTNDAPTIDAAVTSGDVDQEHGDASGTIAFSDVDLADSHSVNVVPATSGYLGVFTASITDTATGSGSGEVSWAFTVDNNLLQYLAPGETFTQTYSVAIADNQGGAVTRDVTIVFTGDNDAPTIASSVTTGAIMEDTVLSASGAIAFADVDLADAHTVSVTAAATGYLGVFNATIIDDATADGVGQIGWTFDVFQPLLQSLAEGETLTQTYAITVSDNASAQVTRNVTITITGQNDAPTMLASLVATNQDTGISGSLTANDIDGDTVTFAIETNPQHGTLLLQADGAYTYVPADGYSGSDFFTVAIEDENGATNSGLVTIDVASGQSQVRYVFENVSIVNLPVSGPQDAPEVTALADGGHLVVWMAQAPGNPDASNYGIYAQRYDATGGKIGAPVLVNTTTNGTQYCPSAAGLNDGGYVIVWQSADQDGSGWGVYAQRFLANGAKDGGEALVNVITSNHQMEPSVTALTDGGYAVTWTGHNPLTPSSEVYVRIFQADGTALANEFVVNTHVTGTQATQGYSTETIVGLAGGRFAVSFVDQSGADGSGYGVYVRVFEADGTPVNATQVLVNTTTTSNQQYGSIGALSGGGFVVTWSDPNNIDGSSWGVLAQRFDADGAKVGGEFQANSYAYSNQLYSKIEQLPDGGFVIVWQSYGVDGVNQYGIAGQRYAVDGTKVGGEFVVNSEAGWGKDLPSIALRDDGALIVVWGSQSGATIEQKIVDDFAEDTTPVEVSENVNLPIAGFHDTPEVAALADGGHVVAWMAQGSANPDTANYGIYIQRYDASGEKAGTAVLVNTTTNGSQYYPAVAGLNDGSYVVVWQSTTGPDGSDWGIYSQRFTANGAKTGGEVLVNTITANGQFEASVTALANGGYVITWTSYNAGNTSTDVYARIFQANGTASAGEFIVNTMTAGDQVTQGHIPETVTGLAGGRFAVTFVDDNDADGSGTGIYVRVFEADGTPVNANQVLANSTTAGYQYFGSIGALADGGFVVTWSDPNSIDGSSWAVLAQRFDVDGAKVGSEFQANTYANSDQLYSKVEQLSDGGFVIVWQSYGPNSGQYAIAGQRYAADGSRSGGEFVVARTGAVDAQAPSIALREDGALIVVWQGQGGAAIEQKIIDDFAQDTTPIDADPDANVSFPITGSQQAPEVTALADGGHLVVWMAYAGSPSNSDTSEYGVYAQRYDASGDKVGGPTLVNTTTDESQSYPSAAGLNDGSYVVIWQSVIQDGSGWGVFAQHFASNGATIGGEVLINAVTDFDQYAPSVTALASGGYTVSWTGYNPVSQTYDVYARVFEADGAALGAEFVVNTTTAGFQGTYGHITESIVGLAGGRFAITFVDESGADGFGYGIYVRVFEANGTPVNAAQVSGNTQTSGYQSFASVGALADGGFVVAWHDHNGADGSSYGVFAQRFDADGVAVGSEFQANTYTYSDQAYPKVEQLADGGFVIIWQSYGVEGSNQFAIAGQRYAADGTRAGGEFIVNSSSGWGEDMPSVALREDGALIVVWRGQNGQSIEQKIITSFDADTNLAKNIIGDAGADSLLGWSQADMIDGAGGDDRIGGLGDADTLTGGTGADTFVYFTPEEGGDTITDFTPGQDKIEVSASGFGGGLLIGGPVTLISSLNPVASGAGGAFLYKTDTGELFWDQDGNGVQTRTLIATLAGAPALTAADFTVTAIVGDGGTTPPIVLDLDGDGLHFLLDRLFDYDSDGALERGAWPVGDAILALDQNGDGSITSSIEISFVGDAEGATTDLEGLAGHDADGDGAITAADPIFDSLLLWQDANNDGVGQASELGTLSAAGIRSISLTARTGDGADAHGNILHGWTDVGMSDGSTRQAADISLRYHEITQSETVADLGVIDASTIAEHSAQASDDIHIPGHHVDADLMVEASPYPPETDAPEAFDVYDPAPEQVTQGGDYGWQ